MKHKKDVIVGLGEIGKPILKVLSKNKTAVGYDINSKLMNKNKFYNYDKINSKLI